MQFASISEVMGRISRPSLPWVLPSVILAPWQATRRSAYPPTLTCKATFKTANIQHTAGGTYGDEFRPD
jgi:hypothetical protein